MKKQCCCELDAKISNLQNQVNSLEDLCEKKVYFWQIDEPGVREQIWSADGNAAPHDNPSNIFSGNTHINGDADIDIIVSNWVDSTSNDPSNGTDQAQWSGYIYIDQDDTQLQDINGNTGERIRVFVGRGCCPPVVVTEVNDVNTAGPDNVGTGIFATLDEGWHKLIFQISDLSAFGGVQLQSDVGGDGNFTNFSGLTSVNLPTLMCKTEDCSYELQEDEFDCVPTLWAECDPIDLTQGEQGTLVCQTFCPMVMAELNSPVGTSDAQSSNFNPLDPAIIIWSNLIEQDNSVVGINPSDDLEIFSDDVCVAQVNASITFYNAESTGATGNAQRAHPELWLLRDGNRVAISQTYIRDANGQDSDTASITWYDPNPVSGTVYQLQVQRDSIGSPATGQGVATMELYDQPPSINYIQVIAHRSFELCNLT